ncbi:hypothetical protein CN692_13370 [Bacillus sp. AFS002410]|uniref:phage tail assembly chaperone n=1 Tax=Bacillus sp. AFS002410 TaxID=2033481 RepID=UPI000BEFE469|nr:hypothetical protein [Bacillus sp. AFS002410]PEJ57398.1 hypothetical protein CN692_13370 [Bacillus sp. AFS002410]
MNITDILLSLDSDDLKVPETKVRIKRLSEVTEQEVLFTLQAIKREKLFEITDLCTKEDGSVDNQEYQLQVVLNGVVDPSLKDQKFIEKFKCVTPYEVVLKLLTAGEITQIYSKVLELSGIQDTAVEEIKKK